MKFGKIAVVAAIFAACIAPVAAQAAAFDAEAASRLYLDLLHGPARARSDAYFEGGYWLLLWGTLISVLADLLLLRLRLVSGLRDRVERLTSRRSLQVWLVAIGYLAIGSVLTLPWVIYTGFLRERDYGLMNQGFGGWLGEHALDTGISALLTSALIVGFYCALRRAPRYWWLVGSGIFTAGAALMLMVYPVYVAPLFNTYAELPQGPVRERILAMAAANHVPAEHVYVYDASRQSNRISANVSGLGPTVRISLNDNLLERTSEPEIAAIMGHEIGHYVLGHNWRLLVVIGLLAGVFCYLLHRSVPGLVRRFGARWGIRSVDDPASMPVFGVMLAVLALISTPITNTIIRLNESAADAFGLDAAREPDGFAMAAMRLAEYRKIEPGWIEEALLYDHPSGATRVRMAMAWKRAHSPEAPLVRPHPLPLEPQAAIHVR